MNHNTAETKLRRVLGLPSLVLFGLAYMVPLTVFTTYGVVNEMTEAHVPLAYMVTLVAMLFTAISYASLVRAYPQAGSAYFYARKAFGPYVGFLTGWTLMLDYLLLPLINYLVIGIYLGAQFPSVPPWLFSLASIIIVTALNVIGISVVKNANLILVGIQLVFALVFVVLAVTRALQHPQASILQPLYDLGVQPGQLFSGAAILALSYLGFDAISTLSEEARDPRRNVPRAIIVTTLSGGALFYVISWAAQIVIPHWEDVVDPDTAAIQIMGLTSGHWLELFFLVAYVAGCVAAAIASQVSVARILYAMGRDKILPQRVFGVLHPKFDTPVRATLVVAAFALIALVADLGTVASLISFGALAAFSLVNLSVIKHFIIDSKERRAKALVIYLILPLLGFAMTAFLWFSLSGLAFEVGLSWFGAGAVYLVWLTKFFRRPPAEIQFDPEDETPGGIEVGAR